MTQVRFPDTAAANTSSSVRDLQPRLSNSNEHRDRAFDRQETAAIWASESPSKPERELHTEDDYGHDPRENDGVLHYEPALETGIAPPAPLSDEDSDIPLQATAKKTRKGKAKSKPKPDREDSQSSSPDTNIQKPPLTQPKAKSKSKSKRSTITLTVEEIHTRLTDRIRADTQLYLRILRYEPLPLDMFVQLLCGDGEEVKITGPLKLQVKGFLDKQVGDKDDTSAKLSLTTMHRRSSSTTMTSVLAGGAVNELSRL